MRKCPDPFMNRVVLALSTMHEISELDKFDMYSYQHYLKKGNRNRMPTHNTMDYSSGYHNRIFRKEPIKAIKPFKMHHELVMASHSKNHKHKHQGPSYKMIK